MSHVENIAGDKPFRAGAPKSYVEKIVEAARPYGEAMVVGANEIFAHPWLLKKALRLRNARIDKNNTHYEEEGSVYTDYRKDMRTLLTNQGVDVSDDDNFNAMLGYLNLQAEVKGFRPTMESFNALVRSRAKTYKEDITPHNQDAVKHAIVAGQFNTGPASPILVEALRQNQFHERSVVSPSRS